MRGAEEKREPVSKDFESIESQELTLQIKDSHYFDEQWYLIQYPDALNSGMQPAQHFLQFGAVENRNPGPLFDTAWYLEKNPDIDPRKINPLIHFLQYGRQSGCYASPYDLLKSKIYSSKERIDNLFSVYSLSSQKRPERTCKSDDEDRRSLKAEWRDYFLAQGVIQYNLGDLVRALSCFKAAAQVSPDEIPAHLMFQHTFHKVNINSLSEFEICYKEARLLVAHISCHSRISLARNSVLSFENNAKDIANIIVVGNPNFKAFEYTFDAENKVLTVPENDSYEALPQKMASFFLFCGISSLKMPILKVDDNIHCRNIDNLRRDLGDVMLSHDYGGRVVPPAGPFFSTTFWHLNKCTDFKINETPDGLLNFSSYVGGPCYWLGGMAINALSKMALIHDRFFQTEIYEDRAVGTVLAYYGFRPYEFCLISSGSLESIDMYLSNTVKGELQEVTRSSISGWSTDGSKGVPVSIFINDIFVATIAPEQDSAVIPGANGGTLSFSFKCALPRQHVTGFFPRWLEPGDIVSAKFPNGSHLDGSPSSKFTLSNFDFGDIGSHPCTDDWGFSRGYPIDRYYVENFIKAHSADITGVALEVGDNCYTTRYGDGRVTESQILDLAKYNEKITLVADLTEGNGIPDNFFDCVILTQVLELIKDVQKAINTVHRILKPGGVALITVPGISQISSEPEEARHWNWSFYPNALRFLLCNAGFKDENIKVESWGNLKTAVGFLAGLSQADLTAEDFLLEDNRYPLIVTARIVKNLTFK